MIYTARQLERLLAEEGRIVLPYQARLTPLATDWVRSRRVQVGYSNVSPKTGSTAAATPQAQIVGTPASPLRYWCDGPCGQAKAALAHLGKQNQLKPIDIAADVKQTVEVVRLLKRELQAGEAALLLVNQAALATVLVNRCPNLRGIVGTSLQAIDQLAVIGPNVLIVEHSRQTMMQVRNIVERFMRLPHVPDEQLRRQLEEAACA